MNPGKNILTTDGLDKPAFKTSSGQITFLSAM